MSRSPTGQAVVIRHGTSADAGVVAEFGARAFAAAFGPHNTPEDMASYLGQAFAEPFIETQLADPRCAFLLAEEDGGLVGYAMLRDGPAPNSVHGEEPVELVRIYADPTRMGTGIGSGLMSAVLEMAAAEGRQTVWLGVWERNARAIAFYQRWGFEKVGQKTFVLGSDPQTDHVMIRRL